MKCMYLEKNDSIQVKKWSSKTLFKVKEKKYFDYSIEKVHWTNQFHFQPTLSTFWHACAISHSYNYLLGVLFDALYMTLGRKIDMRTLDLDSKSRDIEFHSSQLHFNLITIFHHNISLSLTVMQTTCGTIEKSRGSLSCCLSSFSHREQWTAVVPHEGLHQWCRATANRSWRWNVRSRTTKVGIRWLGKFP